MRLFISLVVAVAVVAEVGLVTGRYGSALSFMLLVLLDVLFQLLGRIGLNVYVGWQYGLVVLFWLNVIAFAAPAYALYLARRWFGRGYAPALSLWTALYLALMLFPGRLTELP